MGIKCETKGYCSGKKEYPKLMKSSLSGVIVLMKSEHIGIGTGTVVCGKSSLGNSVGDYATNFGMYVFRDYNEPVTLSNK